MTGKGLKVRFISITANGGLLSSGGDNNMLVVVFIDDFGSLVEPKMRKFKVVLSGSYCWCFVGKCWRHEIKDISPKIPLSYILSDVILVK